MFADSLCKERERGRQGQEVHPRSLLAPLRAPAVPGLCLPVAGGAGDSHCFGHPGHPQPALLASKATKHPVAVSISVCSPEVSASPEGGRAEL